MVGVGALPVAAQVVNHVVGRDYGPVHLPDESVHSYLLPLPSDQPVAV